MLQLIQPHITAYLVGFPSLLTLSQGKLHLCIKTLSFFLMQSRCSTDRTFEVADNIIVGNLKQLIFRCFNYTLSKFKLQKF